MIQRVEGSRQIQQPGQHLHNDQETSKCHPEHAIMRFPWSGAYDTQTAKVE